MLLDVGQFIQEAAGFSRLESCHAEPTLYGVTDGKAVGTYLEAKFHHYLAAKGYEYPAGSAANGLDFPSLNVDVKTTSIKQPQSSCPFRSIRQKIYGLGYGLLVFVYDKSDNHSDRTATLCMTATVFVQEEVTADFQMTKGLIDILRNNGNEDDLASFMASRHLTADEIELQRLAEEVKQHTPVQGYLTISPALQWRLQYKRVIEEAGSAEGVVSVYRA